LSGRSSSSVGRVLGLERSGNRPAPSSGKTGPAGGASRGMRSPRLLTERSQFWRRGAAAAGSTWAWLQNEAKLVFGRNCGTKPILVRRRARGRTGAIAEWRRLGPRTKLQNEANLRTLLAGMNPIFPARGAWAAGRGASRERAAPFRFQSSRPVGPILRAGPGNG